eukprot:768522-Hanusia_phi.AAC.10
MSTSRQALRSLCLEPVGGTTLHNVPLLRWKAPPPLVARHDLGLIRPPRPCPTRKGRSSSGTPTTPARQTLQAPLPARLLHPLPRNQRRAEPR